MDWDKVSKCKHENLYDYSEYETCWTPLCGTAYEYHCRDCGVFFVKCACGFCDGMSGWSDKRWNRFYKKRRKQDEMSTEKS